MHLSQVSQVIGVYYVHDIRDEFCSGGGGVGLKSLARIFVSIACTRKKIKWFCPNIT